MQGRSRCNVSCGWKRHRHGGHQFKALRSRELDCCLLKAVLSGAPRLSRALVSQRQEVAGIPRILGEGTLKWWDRKRHARL